MRTEITAELPHAEDPRASHQLRPLIARAAGLSLVALGVVLGALGQAATSRNYDTRLDHLEPLVRRLHLQIVYGGHPRTVILSAILLIAGSLVFAFATRGQSDDTVVFDPGAIVREGTAVSWRSRRGVLAAALFAAGFAIAVNINVRLLADDYSPFLVWLLFLALALLGRAFALAPSRASAPISFAPRLWEVALLAAALVFFIIVNVRDLDSWRYAAIGDEYAFFDFARAIARGAIHPNMFSQYGVYDQRPVGTSAFQGVSMIVFGYNSFGWRMATVVAMTATIPAVYLVARELFDRKVAVFSTLIFATSHYLISYTHTAYDNVFAILPFTWCLALAVGGLRRSSSTWLYAAGVVGGLGFYTFPTARMAPIVLGLFLLTLGPRAWRPSVLLPIAVGGLIVALPLFATDRIDAISVSRDRTVFGFTPDHADIGDRILQNIPRSSLVWSYNPNPDHFVSGSLLDPVAAVLLALGLGYSLSRVRHQAYRLLAIWLGITTLFAGIFSPYDRAPIDRLHLALPVVAIIAGLGITALVRAGGRLVPTLPNATAKVGVGAFVVLAPLLATLNLHRFLVDSPKVVPTSEERLVMSGLASHACEEAGSNRLAIMTEPRPLLDPALAAYGNKRDVSTRSYVDAGKTSDYGNFGCVVVSETKNTPAPAPGAAIIDQLRVTYGFEEATSETSITYGTEAVVLVRR
ncbi:MAG: glycosyltransferase family 39 protein [Chloroflexota bacterium]|nr:glycosyltransferase family 39 protein [Chloroflexota bacterium]